jgi:hypothetical protein
LLLHLSQNNFYALVKVQVAVQYLLLGWADLAGLAQLTDYTLCVCDYFHIIELVGCNYVDTFINYNVIEYQLNLLSENMVIFCIHLYKGVEWSNGICIFAFKTHSTLFHLINNYYYLYIYIKLDGGFHNLAVWHREQVLDRVAPVRERGCDGLRGEGGVGVSQQLSQLLHDPDTRIFSLEKFIVHLHCLVLRAVLEHVAEARRQELPVLDK